MKAVEIRDAFGLERLAVTERPRPVPGPGQALLRMRAASLNYRDLLMVLGRYNPKQALPLVPCSDGVGEVVEVAADVDRVVPGDRVSPIFAQRWLCGPPPAEAVGSTLGGPLDGTLQELMTVDAEGLVHVPEHLADDEAATLPCAGLTAWNALVTHGELKPGQTVLIQGTGGVSIFAVLFAEILGARSIVTSSSDDKLERVRSLGAWRTINYKTTPDWGREARRLSGGGVDVVVEVGGAGTLQQSVSAVRPGARICLIGNLAGGTSEINVVPIFMRQIRVQGVLVGSRETFEAMNRAVAARELRPAVHRVFPMEQTREALELLASGSHLGKICLNLD